MTLKISGAQMAAPLQTDAAFAAWYVENFMKTHLPRHYWGLRPESRREMTVNGRRYARHFGIADIPSQMGFVTLMWQIGANFFTHPGFHEIAADTRLSGPEKIDAFYEVPEAQAVHAITNPDDRYWYPEMIGLEAKLA